ncbi:MAG: hypothetical protein KC910_38870, partial [Candidatus Eremiobacteraeota bacterium]|nr:hypothetical protein [Candidatus Eremiobacteraeota bacterium]
GIIQVGGGLGYMLGPVGFGLVVGHSYRLAWILVGVSSLIAAALIVYTRRRVMSELTASGWDGAKPPP